MTVKEQLALRTSYSQKIEYLGTVVDALFQTVAALRQGYMDVCKEVYKSFVCVCTQCNHKHEDNKDVVYCERCGSTQVAYAFGEKIAEKPDSPKV